jgi:hypothetical protein
MSSVNFAIPDFLFTDPTFSLIDCISVGVDRTTATSAT